MAEIIQVAKALGHDIPLSFVDKQIAITHPMGPYRPSSMIDFVEGRPVEYDAIWQQPLNTAKKLGLPVPAMEALANRIQLKFNAPKASQYSSEST